MATFQEDTGSRSARVHRLGTNEVSSVDVKYKCFDGAGDADVHSSANNAFGGSTYNVLGVDFYVQYYEIEHLGGQAWEVTVHYESRGADEVQALSRSRSFDTAGQSVRMMQALSETGFSADGSTAPSMGGAINAGPDYVEGVDVLMPALTWTETYDVPSTQVTAAYLRGLAGMTGCVNSTAFRTFAPGEVLFMGASGSQQADSQAGNGPWKLSYKFSAQPGAVLEVNGMTIPKEGWDYVWFVYGNAATSQGNSSAATKVATHAYVNQVYRRENFAYLGIGS